MYLPNDIHDVYRDLGAHIDGFIAVVAHTLVVGASQVFQIIINKCNKIFSNIFMILGAEKSLFQNIYSLHTVLLYPPQRS